VVDGYNDVTLREGLAPSSPNQPIGIPERKRLLHLSDCLAMLVSLACLIASVVVVNPHLSVAWKLVVKACQPLLTIIIILVQMCMYRVPIDSGFGMIAILAGVRVKSPEAFRGGRASRGNWDGRCGWGFWRGRYGRKGKGEGMSVYLWKWEEEEPVAFPIAAGPLVTSLGFAERRRKAGVLFYGGGETQYEMMI